MIGANKHAVVAWRVRSLSAAMSRGDALGDGLTILTGEGGLCEGFPAPPALRTKHALPYTLRARGCVAAQGRRHQHTATRHGACLPTIACACAGVGQVDALALSSSRPHGGMGMLAVCAGSCVHIVQLATLKHELRCDLWGGGGAKCCAHWPWSSSVPWMIDRRKGGPSPALVKALDESAHQPVPTVQSR